MNRTFNRCLVAGILFWFCQFGQTASCQDGLRNLQGQHIELITDIDSADLANDLVAAFDAAVPQWAAFWKLSAGAIDDWKVTAHVIKDKRVFQSKGLIPRRVPDFPFGYALGNSLWVMSQDSDYYTRHLLLHEGVHALAFEQFKGAGPSWFMEGTAELLSVHSGTGASVKINQVPKSRKNVPDWGRFTLLRQRREQSGIPSIETVLNYPVDLKSDVESYGWSWAAAMLLVAYPEYQEAFQQAARVGEDSSPGFNGRLRQTVNSQWPIIAARWRLMCHDLDYGFDWSAERVQISLADRLWDGKPLSVSVAANQGWQSLGPRFAPRMKIKIDPGEKVTLAKEPKPWVSEPAGVTIRYHRGRPLGQLLLVQVPNVSPTAKTLPNLKIQAIDKSTTITVNEHCWLLLRVNDFVGELGDNEGAYRAECSATR